MSSPDHRLRFWFLWFGLPSGEKGHVKRMFTKTLAKLAIFKKKNAFVYFIQSIRLGSWKVRRLNRALVNYFQVSIR